MSCLCPFTIKAGEHYAVSERSGEVSLVHGPALMWRGCGMRTFDQVYEEVAVEGEYAEVKFKDGHTELMPGPTSVVRHPVEHASINIKKAITIGDQELIVVYRKVRDDTGAEAVKRILIRGPEMYVPQSMSEWLHEFSWTGPATKTDSVDQPARKKTDALKFSKLRTIPGKMYFDVEGVRTKDNALITVKLMIFFRLCSVEQMLGTTNDPFAEFINSVSADVIQWCAPKKFDEFLQMTEQLNTLDPYSQLQATALKIGYQVDKVVFRGYDAPGALQRMHDNAIEKRTALALAKETEEEEQKLSDFKLAKQADRAAKQQELEMNKLSHELAMKDKASQADRDKIKADQAVELERLQKIKKLDSRADIGKYLTARDCRLPQVVQCSTYQMPAGSM